MRHARPTSAGTGRPGNPAATLDRSTAPRACHHDSGSASHASPSPCPGNHGCVCGPGAHGDPGGGARHGRCRAGGCTTGTPGARGEGIHAGCTAVSLGPAGRTCGSTPAIRSHRERTDFGAGDHGRSNDTCGGHTGANSGHTGARPPARHDDHGAPPAQPYNTAVSLGPAGRTCGSTPAIRSHRKRTDFGTGDHGRHAGARSSRSGANSGHAGARPPPRHDEHGAPPAQPDNHVVSLGPAGRTCGSTPAIRSHRERTDFGTGDHGRSNDTCGGHSGARPPARHDDHGAPPAQPDNTAVFRDGHDAVVPRPARSRAGARRRYG